MQHSWSSRLIVTMCHLTYLCRFKIILGTCLLSIAITHLLQGQWSRQQMYGSTPGWYQDSFYEITPPWEGQYGDIMHLLEIQDCSQPILLNLDYFL